MEILGEKKCVCNCTLRVLFTQYKTYIRNHNVIFIRSSSSSIIELKFSYLTLQKPILERQVLLEKRPLYSGGQQLRGKVDSCPESNSKDSAQP